MGIAPDFQRVRTALLLRGEPDRVPIMEQRIDPPVMEAFLGKPIMDTSDEVEFWITAGYDFVPVGIGIRKEVGRIGAASGIAGRQISRSTFSNYDWRSGNETEREWVEEGTGIIAGEADFESIRWLDPGDLDYSILDRLREQLPPGAKVYLSMGYIFATVTRLMGFQNFCEKLIEEPDLVARVFEKVGEYQLKVFQNVIGLEVVGATTHPDDVAYANGPMVAPRYLRKYLWPWYAEMARISRQLDKPIVLHSDGRMDALLDDVVDAGFNALHPIEPKVMDIVRVKREYGQKLALIGNIDLIYTLTRGTPEEVEEEVRQRIRDVAPGGGYAVGSANSIPEYVPLENFNAMREAAFRYGKYPIQV